LYVGGRDNCVRVYDATSGKLNTTIDCLGDAANGVSHGYLNGRSLLAVASGSRKFLSENDFDDVDGSSAPILPVEVPGHLRLFDLTGS
jgi:hypothetical protein